MEIKNNLIKIATSNLMVGAGYYTFVLADKVSDKLGIPATGLEAHIGHVGEYGLDYLIRYGLPILAVLGYRKIAERIEDSF